MEVSDARDSSDLEALSALDDPVRGRLYELVSGREESIGRDDAAAALDIGRSLAAYHLDKLVESGLLTSTYQRPPGRGGPGAGRPAKIYSRSDREFAVSVPPREYELAASLLAQTVAAGLARGSQDALQDVARRSGAEWGLRRRHGRNRRRRDIEDALREHGYEPCRDADDTIRLRNCPFHALVDQHRDVVCTMNLALIEGLVTGLDARGVRPVLDPQPGRCCVAIGSDKL